MNNIFCTLCLKYLISKNKFKIKTKTKESLNSYFSARKNPSTIPHQAESCLKCLTKQNLKSLTTLGYPLHLVVEKYTFIQSTYSDKDATFKTIGCYVLLFYKG